MRRAVSVPGTGSSSLSTLTGTLPGVSAANAEASFGVGSMGVQVGQVLQASGAPASVNQVSGEQSLVNLKTVVMDMGIRRPHI